MWRVELFELWEIILPLYSVETALEMLCQCWVPEFKKDHDKLEQGQRGLPIQWGVWKTELYEEHQMIFGHVYPTEKKVEKNVITFKCLKSSFEDKRSSIFTSMILWEQFMWTCWHQLAVLHPFHESPCKQSCSFCKSGIYRIYKCFVGPLSLSFLCSSVQKHC